MHRAPRFCNASSNPDFRRLSKSARSRAAASEWTSSRRHIEKIGGSVDLQSTLGQGTSLTIKIPLTLAIVPALMVGSGGQRFVIPQASLMEVITVGSTAPIEKLHNIPVYRLRDRLLPLVWLDQSCGSTRKIRHAQERASDGLLVTVLQVDGLRYGLVIDEVLNTHEIVVKPIGASIKSIGVYSAATILGDGSVAMILDVGGIARLGGLLSDSGERVDGSNRTRASWPRTPPPSAASLKPYSSVISAEAER